MMNRDDAHWLERAVSAGQLLVAGIVALGGLLTWGLSQEARITQIFERQQAVIARNMDQDLRMEQIRAEIMKRDDDIVKRIDKLDVKLTELLVLNAQQHGPVQLRAQQGTAR
jgi:hypothetical protein